MVKPSSLETQLTAVTQEFVSRIVSILRGASIDDVARLGSDEAPRTPARAQAHVAAPSAAPAAPARVSAARAHAAAASIPAAAERDERGTGRRMVTAKSVDALNAQTRPRDNRPRQTAEVRAELADRIVSTLRAATAPMNVRTLSSEMKVPVDLLTVPLLELRTEGRVSKHGEKRSTTYSVRE